ncbi:MAG: tripartite tricarboxylate transporter substrate-binding protein [Betaproteobacteria bacterium]
MVMPFAPGGPTDIVARLVSERLGARIGQAVVIENRAGANGIIGTEHVAKSAPDGYTLLAAPTSHAINPSIYRKLPYDTLKDFVSVAYLGASPAMVMVVGRDVPAKTVQDFVSLTKTRNTAYAAAGVGNFTHLAGEYFNMVAGTSVLAVQYKGAGPMVQALYSGEVQAAFLGPVQAIGLMKDGRLRPLAVTSPRRLAQLPDVPTLAESGVSGLDLDGGIQAAVYAPAKTPREIVLKLNREINAVLQEPAVRERFGQFALEGAGGPPEELDRQLTAKMQKYAAIVKAAKIEPE